MIGEFNGQGTQFAKQFFFLFPQLGDPLLAVGDGVQILSRLTAIGQNLLHGATVLALETVDQGQSVLHHGEPARVEFDLLPVVAQSLSQILQAVRQILGFTQSEVLRVISRENLLLAFLSIPFGLLVGVLFCYLLVELYDTDLFRFPLALSGATLFRTALGILVFAALANLAVSRRVRRLDIVEALKARE